MARSYPFRISSLTFTVGNLHFCGLLGVQFHRNPRCCLPLPFPSPVKSLNGGLPQNSEWFLPSSEATWHLKSLTFKGRCIFEMMYYDVFFHCYVSLPVATTPHLPPICHCFVQPNNGDMTQVKAITMKTQLPKPICQGNKIQRNVQHFSACVEWDPIIGLKPMGFHSPLIMATLRSPAKSLTFSGLHVKSH